jgi:hypothetical protein
VIVADVVLVLLVPGGWRGAALGAGNAVGMTVAGVALLLALRHSAGPRAVAGLGRAAGVGLVAAATGAALGMAGASLLDAALPSLLLAAALGGLGVVAVLALLDRDELRRLVRR